MEAVKVWQTNSSEYPLLTQSWKDSKWPAGLCLMTFFEVSEEQTQTGLSGIIYTQVLHLKAIPCQWGHFNLAAEGGGCSDCLCFSFILVREYQPSGVCCRKLPKAVLAQSIFCSERFGGCSPSCVIASLLWYTPHSKCSFARLNNQSSFPDPFLSLTSQLRQ